MPVFWISIHICITLQHVPVVDDFLRDLREAVETVSPLIKSLLIVSIPQLIARFHSSVDRSLLYNFC